MAEFLILFAFVATLIGIFTVGIFIEHIYDPIEGLQLSHVLGHLYEKNQQLTVVDVVLILGCTIKKAHKVIAHLEKHDLVISTFDFDSGLTVYERSTKLLK